MSLRRALVPHLSILLMAAGAVVGSAAYLVWPQDVAWLWGLFPLGVGLLALAKTRLGWLPVMSGLFWLLTAWQMQAATAFPWQALGSKRHWVDGVVAAIESGTVAGRATVEVHHVTFYGLAQGPLQAGVLRLGVPAKQAETLAVGEGMAAPVVLYPPDVPAFAGARDYRLWDTLNHDKLFGYVQGKAEPSHVQPPSPTLREQAAATLEEWRQRVKALSGPYAQGVLTALLVADQRQIPAGVRESYRQAGLSHLLAVSGLQLTLVGGGIFWLVRRLLALWPALALRVNGKAIGAVVGLVAALLYAVLAGAPVSVQRALIMVAMLLVAVLTGRLRSLPRAWALALLLVLAVNPAAVMQAGFQLSFAAVGGLILLGLAYGHPTTWLQKTRWLARSSVVAAWATAPFLLLNFGQINVLGVLANLVAIPAMAPITLAAFAGLVLVPFGLQEPLFTVAGWGAAWVNAWAAWVAGLPYATVEAPKWWAWPVAGLAVLALAPVFHRKRGAGGLALAVLLVLGGFAVWWQPRGAYVELLEGGKVAVLVEGRSFRALWNEAPRTVEYWQRQGYVAAGGILPDCDGVGCGYVTALGVVSRVKEPTADDCASARWVVFEDGPACGANALRMGSFAYARLTAEGAEVSLPACARPWQQAAPVCWKEKR
ncbi:MAG: ComEC/Rec2 family competence protein [Pseudomonadaceae bacterium]|nr:ComEC/Rec2 family competence protein [Pseudomonadaceae bacterium]